MNKTSNVMNEMEASMSSSTVLSSSWLEQFAASRAAFPIGMEQFTSSTAPASSPREASPKPSLTSASPEPKLSPISGENTKQFLCNQCGYMATSKGSLTQHIQYIHDTEKKYNCTECEFKSKQKNDLKRHVDTVHNGEKHFFCSECGFQTGKKSNLKVHIESVHEGKRHFCNQCGYQATTEGHLNRHKRSSHNATYHCELCNFQSLQKIDVIKHKYAIHEGQKFYCDLCDYQASRRTHLKKHHERQHSEMTYSCELCEFETKASADFRTHLRVEHNQINSEVKRFPCSDCDYIAARKTHLKSHQQRKHSSQGQEFNEHDDDDNTSFSQIPDQDKENSILDDLKDFDPCINCGLLVFSIITANK